MFRKSIMVLLSATILLVACQTDSTGSFEPVGTLGGAAAGGQMARGSGTAAATFDESTRAKQRAYTAPVGQRITWNNPSTNSSGTITPVRDGYASNGAYCREFEQTIIAGGQQKQAYSKACQQPDGTWKIVP